MAYPTIFDQCWNEQHDQCPAHELKDRAEYGFVCGGGFCICECHWKEGTLNQPWIDQVRESVRRAKEAS